MKKLVMVLALVAAVISAKAASVDWQMSATAADEGTTVYLLTSINDDWANASDLVAAAVGQGTVAPAARGAYAVPKTTSASASITKDSSFFYAIVSADGSSFNYVEASGLASVVYDPEAQESSAGIYKNTTLAQVQAGQSKSFGGGSGDVPEPTSGLLLLVGGAALALRRKQK